jgi:hypothetical protein
LGTLPIAVKFLTTTSTTLTKKLLDIPAPIGSTMN